VFTESEHPRGQAGNAGQFRTKINSAPAGHLTGDAPAEALVVASRASEARAASAYYAQVHQTAADVEAARAKAAREAPSRAAGLVYSFTESDDELAYPEPAIYVDGDGLYVGAADGQEPLTSARTGSQLRAAGLTELSSDQEGGGEWLLSLRAARVERPIGQETLNAAHHVHLAALRIGVQGGTFADMLLAAAGEDEEAAAALRSFQDSDIGNLAADYDQLLRKMRAAIVAQARTNAAYQ